MHPLFLYFPLVFKATVSYPDCVKILVIRMYDTSGEVNSNGLLFSSARGTFISSFILEVGLLVHFLFICFVF